MSEIRKIMEGSWQIGVLLGQSVFSRKHLFRDGDLKALCGAQVNWKYGNWSHNNSGLCQRCFAIRSKQLGGKYQAPPPSKTAAGDYGT